MDRAKSRARRCAIYTRKSSEEGLEQDFNSLHAQREACEAFIKSQASEGWKLIKIAYDDGGLSGATMERPALKRLLADIGEGLVDVVVVYKVDRLTRSLADFAKMVELFDARGVSFVAVTQQFNTTTSMGRLTLNVLLSFAQFEREVTGERIRDKIAASKRKGMWMGGVPPLGYEVKERRLVINPTEAETVRHIYERYLEFGCVRQLRTELDERGIVSKVRVSKKGVKSGGCRFSRGALYELLANPIYVGEIRHKQERHPGQHEPILPRELWEKVQQRLREKAVRGATAFSSAASTFLGRSPLAGMTMRVSTPRRFMLSGTRRDRLTILLVRTLAREQGTWILSVTDMPSSRSSTRSMSSTIDALASASFSSCRDRAEVESIMAFTSGDSMSALSSASSSAARSFRICRPAIATARSISGAARRQPFPSSFAEPLTRRRDT